MKKRFPLLIAAFSFLLTGCLENTQEININEDGSGTISTTSDMSALISMAKQFAGEKMDDIPKEKIDTIISLAQGVDSIENLTAEEKEIMKTGILNISMDMPNEKMQFGMKFPFSSASQINTINSVANKVLAQTVKDKAGETLGGDDAGGDMPGMPGGEGVDEYFTTTYSNGVIERKLNKEKYAGVDNNELLTSMKQMTAMGLTMKNTYVINLPKPATKAEGKNVTLSEDKKKVTIETTLDDFFDDPSAMEFKIDY